MTAIIIIDYPCGCVADLWDEWNVTLCPTHEAEADEQEQRYWEIVKRNE